MSDNDKSKHSGSSDAADQELSDENLDAVSGGTMVVGTGGIRSRLLQKQDDLPSPSELLRLLTPKESKTPSAQ